MLIGIDVGGTNISGGLASYDGVLAARVRRRTDRAAGARAGLQQICEIITELRELAIRQCHEVLGIGVGFGGPVDGNGVVRLSHHVAGWEGIPLRDELQSRFTVLVAVDNDANAGTLAEWKFGAGQGFQDLIYVNVGTGIGGGLVSGGRLLRGVDNLAGEIGHTTVTRAGPRCTCGRNGCLEALASGDAIARRGSEACGVPLTGKEVFARAAAGDAAARAVLGEVVEDMAHGIGTAVSLLNPSIVIIGGGLSAAPENLFLQPLRLAVPRFCLAEATPQLRIEAAQLGYDAGVLGAVALAMEGSEQP